MGRRAGKTRPYLEVSQLELARSPGADHLLSLLERSNSRRIFKLTQLGNSDFEKLSNFIAFRAVVLPRCYLSDLAPATFSPRGVPPMPITLCNVLSNRRRFASRTGRMPCALAQVTLRVEDRADAGVSGMWLAVSSAVSEAQSMRRSTNPEAPSMPSDCE